MPLHHASRLLWVNLGDHPEVSGAGPARLRFTLTVEARDIEHDAGRNTWFATYRARIGAVCRVQVGCARTSIGLDLRALPTGTSSSGIEMFGRGEASDFVGLAPASAAPQIFMTPGTASFVAVFEAASDVDAKAQCEQTVAAYLPTGPRLPILMTPAAHVTEACGTCPSAR
jgi:hypothetical protein